MASGGGNEGKSGGAALTKKFRAPIEDSNVGFRGSINAGDDGADPEANEREDGTGTSGSTAKRRKRTDAVAKDEKLPEVDLAKEAPLPSEPILISKGDTLYEGVLRFTVILKSPAAAPPQPVEGQ